MKILYIGDIMGRPGRETVQQVLPDLIKQQKIDFVIAQGENLSGGKGMRPEAVTEMRAAGIDAFTGGNWSWANKEIYPLLQDAKQPIVRPANYPGEAPGRGWTIVETAHGRVLIICLLGQIVGANTPQVANPLRTVDQILETTKHENLAARIVDFHGDYSSEKLVIGQYLDGRVTAVVGDHWHIPTADAMVLPKGTAHITDVGMVGSLDSCLGVKTDIIVQRWMTQMPSRNQLESDGRRWFCAVMITLDSTSGLASGIEQVVKILPN